MIAGFLVTGSAVALTGLANRIQGADSVNEKMIAPTMSRDSPFTQTATRTGGGSGFNATHMNGTAGAGSFSVSTGLGNSVSQTQQQSEAAQTSFNSALEKARGSSSSSGVSLTSGSSYSETMSAGDGRVASALKSISNSVNQTHSGDAKTSNAVNSAVAASAEVGGSASLGRFGQKALSSMLKGGSGKGRGVSGKNKEGLQSLIANGGGAQAARLAQSFTSGAMDPSAKELGTTAEAVLGDAINKASGSGTGVPSGSGGSAATPADADPSKDGGASAGTNGQTKKYGQRRREVGGRVSLSAKGDSSASSSQGDGATSALGSAWAASTTDQANATITEAKAHDIRDGKDQKWEKGLSQSAKQSLSSSASDVISTSNAYSQASQSGAAFGSTREVDKVKAAQRYAATNPSSVMAEVNSLPSAKRNFDDQNAMLNAGENVPFVSKSGLDPLEKKMMMAINSLDNAGPEGKAALSRIENNNSSPWSDQGQGLRTPQKNTSQSPTFGSTREQVRASNVEGNARSAANQASNLNQDFSDANNNFEDKVGSDGAQARQNVSGHYNAAKNDVSQQGAANQSAIGSMASKDAAANVHNALANELGNPAYGKMASLVKDTAAGGIWEAAMKLGKSGNDQEAIVAGIKSSDGYSEWRSSMMESLQDAGLSETNAILATNGAIKSVANFSDKNPDATDAEKFAFAASSGPQSSFGKWLNEAGAAEPAIIRGIYGNDKFNESITSASNTPEMSEAVSNYGDRVSNLAERNMSRFQGLSDASRDAFTAGTASRLSFTEFSGNAAALRAAEAYNQETGGNMSPSDMENYQLAFLSGAHGDGGENRLAISERYDIANAIQSGEQSEPFSK